MIMNPYPIYCRQCKQVINPVFDFCPSCGASQRLSVPAPNTSAVHIPPVIYPPLPTGKTPTDILIDQARHSGVITLCSKCLWKLEHPVPNSMTPVLCRDCYKKKFEWLFAIIGVGMIGLTFVLIPQLPLGSDSILVTFLPFIVAGVGSFIWSLTLNQIPKRVAPP